MCEDAVRKTYASISTRIDVHAHTHSCSYTRAGTRRHAHGVLLTEHLLHCGLELGVVSEFLDHGDDVAAVWEVPRPGALAELVEGHEGHPACLLSIEQLDDARGSLVRVHYHVEQAVA